ncbi:DUF6531 domain-containing protein [Streptomyces sp. HUAS MG47]|uniref:DUF6531 domain-containing protein n=1 Tax=Streptomyces solicamelliae TaxID=3231716 RepID=UPI0038780D03
MTLKERRAQVASEKTLGRMSSAALPQSGKSMPEKSGGKAKLRTEAAAEEVQYTAKIERAEVWDASGRLRGWDEPGGHGFTPRDGEKFTVKGWVFAGGIDTGSAPVNVRFGWVCGVNLNEPIKNTVDSPMPKVYYSAPVTVSAPSHLTPGEGAPVSFSVTFQRSDCLDDIKRNDGKAKPDPYVAPMGWQVSVQGQGLDGTYDSARSVLGIALADLPGNQTFGSSCGSNSASAPACAGSRGVGVNTATGAFSQTVTDASVPGTLPLDLRRSYSSNNIVSGSLGAGWSASWDARLDEQTNGNVVFRAEDGSQYPFTKTADGTYASEAHVGSTLTKTATGYELKTRVGNIVGFDASGNVTEQRDRQGRKSSFEYSSGRLVGVTTNTGQRATFAYSGSLLSEISLWDGRKVSYEYTGGRLTSFMGPDGKPVNYGYDAGGRLQSISDKRGNEAVRNTYDSQGRVVEQQAGFLTGKISFAYSGEETDVTMPDAGVWTDIHHDNVLLAQYDPFGNKTSFEYDFQLDPVAVTDALGNRFGVEFDPQGRPTKSRGPLTSQSWAYTAAGGLNYALDDNGKMTRFGWDSKNQLWTVIDPLGVGTEFTYTPAGKLESEKSPEGRRTVYAYDAAGNVSSVTTGGGQRLTRTYDATGRVKTEVDPRGNVEGAAPADYTTTCTYDAGGRVASAKDAKGNVTAFAYDAAGNLTSTTNSAGKVTSHTYDAANRLTETKDALGRVSTVTYDVMGNVASETDAAGAKTTYAYDKAGRLVSKTMPRGNLTGATAGSYTWKYGYDKVGNRTSVTDPGGKTTKTDYDAENRPVKVTDPLGRVRTTAYDGAGNVRATIDALGKVTTYTYDGNNRRLSAKDPSGKTISFGYDRDGNKISETSPLGHKTTFAYDANGRQTERTDPRGNVTGAVPAQYTWRTSHDAAGNVTAQTDPLGNKVTSAYDAVGNLTERTDPLGKKTVSVFDALNRPTKVTAPDGGVTLVEYDALGQMTKRTDANQQPTLYGYDSVGRLTKVTDPLGRSTSYAYDVEGNRTKVTNARGQTITTAYGPRSLPTKTTYSDGTPTVSYGYDSAGQTTSVTDGTGTRNLTYDLNGRVLTIGQPGATKPFTYTYNPNGTLASRAYPDGRTTAFTYDDDGRVTGQTTNAKTTAYAWDEAGNLTSTKLPTTAARTESRTYDQAGRLTSMTEGNGNRTFERDAAGRVISDTFKDLATTKPATRYGYDTAGRLTRSCTDTTGGGSCLSGTAGETYTYDKVGNRLTTKTATATTTNTYDAADQLTRSVTGTTTSDFTYDADGNLAKNSAGTYAYTAEGRVKTATIGTKVWTYGYDADGNRTSLSVDGALQRTAWWDVNNKLPVIASERATDGTLMGNYEYDPLGAPLAMDNTKGSYYFQNDRQGSVTAVYDAAGTENYAYTYGPWGATKGAAGITGGQTSPFGYTGEYKDPSASNWLYLRDRSYHYVTGRFNTPDPEPTSPGSPNSSAYAYANNDPINQSDPSGRCPLCISAGIGAIIGGAIEGGIYSWQHRNDGQFSWGDFAEATGRGAAIGGLAGALMPGAGNAVVRGLGLTGGRALATSAGVNAVVGAGFSWGVNTALCRPTDPWDLVIGAAGGGVSSLLGPTFNWLKNRFSPGNPVPRYGPGAAHPDDPAFAGKPPLPIPERLSLLYQELDRLPTARDAESALRQLNSTLDRVEDAYSGVAKNPNPGLKPDGRMYAPRDDFIERHADGSLRAVTRGNTIEIGADGTLQIYSRRSGELVYSKEGGGK